MIAILHYGAWIAGAYLFFRVIKWVYFLGRTMESWEPIHIPHPDSTGTARAIEADK